MKRIIKGVLGALGESREILLVLIAVLGMLFICFGFFQFKQIKDLDTWELRSPPSLALVYIGSLGVAASIFLTLLTRDKSKKILPDISGRWHYFVSDSCNRPSHTGKCNIVSSDGDVSFSGIRRYVVENRAGKRGAIEKNWPWESTWTDYGTDDWFRCEYKFKSFNGYFKVRFADDVSEINEFEGTYYLLPDSCENGVQPPNAMYGTIKFQRVEQNEYRNVKPPVGLEVWEE